MVRPLPIIQRSVFLPSQPDPHLHTSVKLPVQTANSQTNILQYTSDPWDDKRRGKKGKKVTFWRLSNPVEAEDVILSLQFEPFPFPVIPRFFVSYFPPQSSLPHFRLVIQSLIKCQRTSCCPRVLAPSASWNTYFWCDRSPSGPVEGVSTFIQNPDETT